MADNSILMFKVYPFTFSLKRSAEFVVRSTDFKHRKPKKTIQETRARTFNSNNYNYIDKNIRPRSAKCLYGFLAHTEYNHVNRNRSIKNLPEASRVTAAIFKNNPTLKIREIEK